MRRRVFRTCEGRENRRDRAGRPVVRKGSEGKRSKKG